MFNFITLQTLFLFDLFLLIILLLLLFWLWRLTSHYNRLIRSTKAKSLIKVLESLQKTLAQHEKKILKQEDHLSQLKTKLRQSLQKVILHRFNPFTHTGGKQSFILALLDEDDNGILLTSLHSRENTRFYVKSIKRGEGEEFDLSPEEEKILRSKRRSK